MTLQDWGAIGELISAIAVVVTLIYLAKEIRVNTHALDEGRKLALAQTYQMRADALQAMLVEAADSAHIGPIIIKLTGLGYPEDVSALATHTADMLAHPRIGLLVMADASSGVSPQALPRVSLRRSDASRCTSRTVKSLTSVAKR